MLTASTTQKYFNAIKQKLDFLGMAYIDRAMVKVKTSKKDNNGNAIEKNKISGESRVINFRDDTYSVDSKCRFANIVDQIPFDADALIKAMQDAILAEQAKDGKSLAQAKKEQAEQAKVDEEKAKANSAAAKKQKENAEAEASREDILADIKKKFTNVTDENKKAIKAKLTDKGFKTLNDPEVPIDLLQEINDMLTC